MQWCYCKWWGRGKGSHWFCFWIHNREARCWCAIIKRRVCLVNFRTPQLIISQSSFRVLILRLLPSRRMKTSDISNNISKGAPDFCTVYVISKGKVSSIRNATRPAPTVSHLRNQVQTKPSVKSDSRLLLSATPKGLHPISHWPLFFFFLNHHAHDPFLVSFQVWSIYKHWVSSVCYYEVLQYQTIAVLASAIVKEIRSGKHPPVKLSNHTIPSFSNFSLKIAAATTTGRHSQELVVQAQNPMWITRCQRVTYPLWALAGQAWTKTTIRGYPAQRKASITALNCRNHHTLVIQLATTIAIHRVNHLWRLW